MSNGLVSIPASSVLSSTPRLYATGLGTPLLSRTDVELLLAYEESPRIEA